jgi:hypothetical protein
MEIAKSSGTSSSSVILSYTPWINPKTKKYQGIECFQKVRTRWCSIEIEKVSAEENLGYQALRGYTGPYLLMQPVQHLFMSDCVHRTNSRVLLLSRKTKPILFPRIIYQLTYVPLSEAAPSSLASGRFLKIFFKNILCFRAWEILLYVVCQTQKSMLLWTTNNTANPPRWSLDVFQSYHPAVSKNHSTLKLKTSFLCLNNLIRIFSANVNTVVM